MATLPSRLVVVGALVVLVAFGLAAVLFVQGGAATERLGLLFALIGTVVAALISTLRADQAATQANGALSSMTAQSEAFRKELPIPVQTAVLAELAAPIALAPPIFAPAPPAPPAPPAGPTP